MYTKIVTIINPSGLHARPASDFVEMAKKFESNITIKKVTGTRPAANAKSILFLLAQGLTKGSQAEITAEGADETEAVNALAELIESGFGEA